MRHLPLGFVLALVLAGCQGDDARYDVSAKAKARAVAPTIASYVTNTAQWNPDLVVTVEDGAADQSGMPPGWMYGSQEPLPGS